MAKRITAIVSLSIIGILIIATIIMANINVKYNVKCGSPNQIIVSYNSVEGRKVKDENVKSIENLISNASKEKSLTALFNGTLNKEAKVVYASSVGKTLTSNDGFYVRYRYENPQELKQGDKAYKDSKGEKVYYEDLVFEVDEDAGLTQVKVYVIPDSQKPNTYTHYYELEANFDKLYDYLVDNDYNV